MRAASRPTEEVLESAPNATTSDDRGGSVRIPLAGERRESKGERARDSEIEREQRANPPSAAPTRRIRRDEEEVGKAGGRREEVRSYYAVHLVAYDAAERAGAEVMTEAK